MTTDTTAATAAMTAGRRADTTRRRQRVTAALATAVEHGDELTVATIARRAGVDRSFLYRHPDLLEQLHAAQAQPSTAAGPAVSRASLQADLLAAQQRNIRLAAQIRQLETRLSELLGEHTWRTSGLGAPDDIDHLKQRIVTLEQQTVHLQIQLDERAQDLDAARATNRALMAQLNATRST